jgi:hypothetical protein
MRLRHIGCRKEIGASAKSSISPCARLGKTPQNAKNQVLGAA